MRNLTNFLLVLILGVLVGGVGTKAANTWPWPNYGFLPSSAAGGSDHTACGLQKDTSGAGMNYCLASDGLWIAPGGATAYTCLYGVVAGCVITPAGLQTANAITEIDVNGAKVAATNGVVALTIPTKATGTITGTVTIPVQ